MNSFSNSQAPPVKDHYFAGFGIANVAKLAGVVQRNGVSLAQPVYLARNRSGFHIHYLNDGSMGNE